MQADNTDAGPWNKNVEFRIKELESHIDRTYWELLVPLFKKKVADITKRESIIDVGCGLGFLTGELAAYSEKITGIDISDISISYAREKFKNTTNFINASIIEYQHNHQDVFFDICIANMVFHNIEKIGANISVINRFLKPEGVLLFSIPHPSFWYKSRSYFDKESYFYEQEKLYNVPFQIRGRNRHPSKIAYWHRSLEFYSRMLEDNGFITIEQLEPRIDNTETSDILFWKCQKIR
jgi:2-polyprenyl-3-methyl-5-hydroxy-6-metoxy-1,4-benzoquinol methylase